jgi:acyl dehydratase
VRGADTLYWEDVTQGDEIPQIIRGPLNRLDMTCYYAGAVGTSGYKSTKLKWKYAWNAKHHPELLPNNYDPSYYAAAISPSIGHQDESVAQSELGMPNAYDNGPQRIGMMTSCVTNWIGDDGEVRELSVRLKLPVIFGDINYFKGRVTGKRLLGKDALVDCEIWAENQLGQVTAKGTVSAALPRRA